MSELPANIHLYSDEKEMAISLFYRDAFRNVLRIVNLQALIILALVLVFAFFVITDEKQDRFFAETALGRKMQVVGLNYPNMGRVALMNWVAQASAQIMTFSFNDVDERLSLASKNFTPDGWRSFHKAMVESGLVGNIIKAQQVLTSAPKAPPTLMSEGIINGNYSWIFEMPLLITFRSGSVKQATTKTVRIVLEKVPTRDNPSGVGISEWYIY